MKKSLLLLLFGTILCACADKNERLVFVTDIVMPSQSQVFTPGDEVTVSARGVEADDRIMFEVYWEEGAESFAPNGSARGVWDHNLAHGCEHHVPGPGALPCFDGPGAVVPRRPDDGVG